MVRESKEQNRKIDGSWSTKKKDIRKIRKWIKAQKKDLMVLEHNKTTKRNIWKRIFEVRLLKQRKMVLENQEQRNEIFAMVLFKIKSNGKKQKPQRKRLSNGPWKLEQRKDKTGSWIKSTKKKEDPDDCLKTPKQQKERFANAL